MFMLFIACMIFAMFFRKILAPKFLQLQNSVTAAIERQFTGDNMHRLMIGH